MFCFSRFMALLISSSGCCTSPKEAEVWALSKTVELPMKTAMIRLFFIVAKIVGVGEVAVFEPNIAA